MKVIFALTLALLVLGTPVAFAADEHRDAQHSGSAQGQDRAHNQARQQSQPRAQDQARPQAQPMAPQQSRSEAQVAPHNQPRNQHSQVKGVPANNSARGTALQNRTGGSASRARTNVDIHAYQRNVSAPRHFQAGLYRAPQGYSYRRWSWGQRLPAIYFGQDYWIRNFSNYGLFAPPYGLVWVRFGPDALLIDEYSGEIVQVDYGLFY